MNTFAIIGTWAVEILTWDVAGFGILCGIVFGAGKPLLGSERLVRIAEWHKIYRLLPVLFPWLLPMLFLMPRLRRWRSNHARLLFLICGALALAGISLIVFTFIRSSFATPWRHVGLNCLFFGYVFLSLSVSGENGGDDDSDEEEPNEPDTPTGDAVDLWLRMLGQKQKVEV